MTELISNVHTESFHSSKNVLIKAPISRFDLNTNSLFTKFFMFQWVNYIRLISSILIFTLVLVLVNNSFFIHIHILPDGRIIEHSHPVKNHKDSNDLTHSHTPEEFFLLAVIYNLFNNSLPCSISFVFYSDNPLTYIISKSDDYTTQSFQNNNFTRAPPLTNLS